MRTTIFITIMMILVLSCKPTKQITSSSPIHTVDYKGFKEYKGDTLNYLKDNFFKRKQVYEGQELNVLLNDMEIEVKGAVDGNTSNRRYISTGILLEFNTLSAELYKSGNHIRTYTLNVRWQKPMQMANIDNFRNETGVKSDWTEAHKAFFGKQIVKSIELIVSH